jgi:hypothetical protein
MYLVFYNLLTYNIGLKFLTTTMFSHWTVDPPYIWKIAARCVTAFRCLLLLALVMTDYEEDFENHHALDALENVDSHLKGQNPDFELWRRLK